MYICGCIRSKDKQTDRQKKYISGPINGERNQSGDDDKIIITQAFNEYSITNIRAGTEQKGKPIEFSINKPVYLIFKGLK